MSAVKSVQGARAETVGRPGLYRASRWSRFRANLAGFAFISPWVLGYLAFTVFPFVASFVLSMTVYDIGSPPAFIGLKNFTHMFTADGKFAMSIRVTFLYAFMVVPATTVLAVGTALLLNQKVRGIPFFRTAFYIPAMVSSIGWLLLWTYILQKQGALNWALAKIGIEGPAYLYDKNWALPALAMMELFSVGSSMLVALAALQGVPEYLYEATDMDGGGEWAKFWHVTLPMISPALFYNVTMSFIGVMQTFAKGYIMTEGGPRDRTLFYALYLYNNAFWYNRMGYACALAWVLFVIILIITALNFLGGRYWVFYESEGAG
ncbi:MAG: sugar ABC transporter permease [Anaerolineae bacterium]|nr:sugar ABC transporter permease [Anaerolineae bacterium]